MIRHPELHHTALCTISLFCDKNQSQQMFVHLPICSSPGKSQVGKESDALGLSQSQEHGREWHRVKERQNWDSWEDCM